jgi:hypothetical protein
MIAIGRQSAMFILFALAGGCANVAPYARETLADPIMQLSERPLGEAYEEHMHRALAQGLVGPPAGGGGCGCEQ